jgi:excisionase family DNA binding protein
MEHQIAFNDRVFSISEAADHLRISRSFIYALVNEARLRPIKIGTRAVITGAEISRFLASAASASPDKTSRRAV